MQNFDTARDALETSLTSSGSAMAEHAKWSKSLEAQLLKLKATWQSLSQSFLQSDFLKVALDAVIGLVNGLDKLISTIGTLPTLAVLFSAYQSFNGKGFFKVIIDEATGAANGMTNVFTNAFNKIKTLITSIKSQSAFTFDDSFAQSLENDKAALTMYKLALDSGMSSQEAFDTIMQEASPAAQKFAQTMEVTSGSIKEFTEQQKMSQLSLQAQDKSFANCNSLINTYNNSMQILGLSQEEFLQSIQKSNPALYQYLAGLKGADGSLKGYIGSLVGAKVATVALKAVTMALNAVLSYGIGLLVSLAFQGISKLINAKKELSERVEELSSKFEEEHKKLQQLKGDYNTSNESSMISKYEKLSKGVDEFGKNISLTTDEYSEYQSVVNKIADQFPTLVSGYDSQGNAILGVKGNVEELVKAYEDLIEAENRAVLNESKDIQNDFRNAVKDANSNKTGFLGLDDKISIKEIEQLEQFLNGDYSSVQNKSYESYTWSLITQAMHSAGATFDNFQFTKGVRNSTYNADVIEEQFNKNKSAIASVINNFYADLEEETDGMRSLATATISNAFDLSDSDFYGMNDTLKNVARQVVDGFDYKFFAGLIEDGKSVESYVNDMLAQLNKLNGGDIDQIEASFSLQTKFNNGYVSYGEFVHGVEDAGNLIDSLNLSDDIKKHLKLSLGLNEDDLVEEYETLLNRLTATNKDNISKGNIIGLGVEDAKKFIDGLSAEELSVITDIIPKLDANATTEQIQSAINREMAVQGLYFDLNLEVETASIDAFNTALQETVSASGLSSDSIAALKSRYKDLESDGYNLSAMFEETANGVHLNRKAVRELEKAYAEQKKNDIESDIGDLKDEYDLLTKEIEDCNDASERASLYVQRDAILRQINDAATLASQYEGLTSAYNDWLNAEDAGQERDMYEELISGLEDIDDEISRGWLDDGTIEFLELLTGRDLTTAPIEDLKQAYKDLDKTISKSGYSIRDFFTVNEDGDSTNTGVYNFLETIEDFEDKLGDVIKRNEDGRITGFDFKVAGGDEAIAEALGISEELVEIMVRAADDAGFVVNLEGAYTQLADLKTEAETARDTLIDLKKNGLDKLKDVDVNFDLSADGEDLLAEQEKAVKLLDKFRNTDGTINLELDGAQQALDIAEYLTIRLDDLTEPRYMQVDTSILDEDIGNAVEQMQEFERLSKEKHLLSLTGDTKGLENVNAEMNEIAEYLYQIDDEEVKAKLDIEGLDTEEIKAKLESGEIELAAELNLDVQMSDDLKDMRLMMMNQLGLVSDNEIKLKIGYDIDDSVVNKLTDGQQEVVVKFLADHSEVDKWTPEQKNALVKYLVDYGDVTQWSPETKEAFVKYFVDEEELQNWSPEAKTAFVKYLVDGGEPDKFNPEDEETWVVYKKDSTEVDGYTAKDLTSTVTYEKDSTDVDEYDPPDLHRKVYYYAMGSNPYETEEYRATNYGGQSGLNGTAHVYGTSGRAFKQGDWRTKKTENALVGELGREIVVTPDNKWHTVGDNGAEFANIPRGSIIFNHRQTEELLSNGKVTSGGGRGKAYASGTAYAYAATGIGGGMDKVIITADKVEVDGGSSGSGGGGDKNEDGKGVNSFSSSSSSSSSSEDTEETFDWIETAIDRVERAIDKLDQKANNVYSSWSSRNSALTDEISKVGDEIELQEDAYSRYIKEANSVGLSDEWKKKVQNGTIDISTITDEDLADKISNYQTWYEKALDCKDTIEDLKETESKLYAQRFENVQTQYDGILQGYEHTESMLNEYISQAEEQGHIISKKYYQALINNERQNISTLRAEQAALIAKRDEAVASGKIKKGSEEWYNMCEEIDGVTQAIESANTSIKEYDKTMRQIDWDTFDLKQEHISDVTAESDFLIDLMSNKDLHDDNGNLTAQGAATLGLHGLNHNVHMSQADDYAAEIADIDSKIASGKLDGNDQNVINRRRDLVAAQRESILAAEDEKQAIKDLVEDGINKELDALQDLIDKKNEALESEKDLYDYQKKVKEQTEEIASIEKQMAAYEGDNSEEARAKIQELKVSLEEAEENLKETEWDKYIDDTSELLDNLYTEYETILNTRLDNVDDLLSQVVAGINAGMGADGAITSALGADGAIATAIANTVSENGGMKSILNSELGAVGGTLSNAMNTIWTTPSTGTNSILSTYGSNFQSQQTTTNLALGDIKRDVDKMVVDSNKEADKKVNENKTTTSAKKDPTGNKTSSKNTKSTDKKTTDKKTTPTIKVGGKINAGSAKIYDYAGDKSGETQYFKSDPTYKVLEEKNSYLKVRWHKLTSGVTGWFKKSDVKALATGAKKINANDMAWTQEKGREYIVRPSDGAVLTPVAKGDSVLNAAASNNIWDMANNPSKFIKDNLNIGSANVPISSNIQNSYTQHLDRVVFNLPNVKNYEELLSSMKKDKNFERLILSMSIDRLAGKSSLAKGKSIR